MGSLFSKKKKPETRITAEDEAVLQLKSLRDKLKVYQRRVEANLERERMVAKQLVQNGKKEKALLLLKKKRFQETMIQRALQQLDSVDKMIHDVEFAQIEAKVLEGLKAGNESLKSMHRLMSVEDVEKILDETRESVEYQHAALQEIDSLLSGELTDGDLSDVESELAQLLADAQPQLPDVPADEPLSAAQDEAEDERPTKRPKAQAQMVAA